jgi:hypothetical protein
MSLWKATSISSLTERLLLGPRLSLQCAASPPKQYQLHHLLHHTVSCITFLNLLLVTVAMILLSHHRIFTIVSHSVLSL